MPRPKAEILHEGWGHFTIKRRKTKDGEELIFEARISDNPTFGTEAKKPKKVRNA